MKRTLAELLEAAYAEGYRSGYGNGHHDREYGEDYDDTYGDGFYCWVNGDSGEQPFPELTSPDLVIGTAVKGEA